MALPDPNFPTTDPAAAHAQAGTESTPARRPSRSEQLTQASERLRALSNGQFAPTQRAALLDQAYSECITLVESHLPTLIELPLPLPRKTRQRIRALQDLLTDLQEILSATLEMHALAMSPGSPLPPSMAPIETSTLLWRALHALSRHLFISCLTAAPPGLGVWKRLHQTYQRACLTDRSQSRPAGTKNSLQDEYYAAVLLGCAQPSSFTSLEVAFLATYLERFANQVDLTDTIDHDDPASFWIDSTRDAPATPSARKLPPSGITVLHFSCGQLAALLERQLSALESGASPRSLNLPLFAATPAGRGMIGRLINFWGNPGKRRFPRRRQNYRGELCFGFDNLCRLYTPGAETASTSVWMIINESPDGYAAMHASGPVDTITVGDVVALRTETGTNWQLCVIRWALSENQEHLEIGLQVLAVRAYVGSIARHDVSGPQSPQPVLVLPAAPVLRTQDALLLPSGTLPGEASNYVLIIEKDNISVREIKTEQRDEQTSLIEIYGISPAPFET